MLSLLRKDLLAGALFLLGVAILIPFLSTIVMAAMIDDFGGISLGFFTLIVAVLCVGASFILIIIDTSYKTEATYASLPLKRSTIVGARYVSSVLISVFGFLLVVLSCWTTLHIFRLGDPSFGVILNERGMISMIMLLMSIIAFMLPFVFKFGPNKGAIAAIIVQVGLILLVPLFEFIVNALRNVWNFDIMFIHKLLLEVLTWIAGQPAIYTYLFAFSIVFIFFMVSAGLSVRFYNRRDL